MHPRTRMAIRGRAWARSGRPGPGPEHAAAAPAGPVRPVSSCDRPQESMGDCSAGFGTGLGAGFWAGPAPGLGPHNRPSTARRHRADSRPGQAGERTLAGMPLIALDGLTKRYGGGVTALDRLTLDIEPGIIGLVGANGAGKSTLLKLLLGCSSRPSGTARVMGLDVRHNGPAVRQSVGYMPEHDCLPPDASATDFVGPHGPDVRAAAVGRARADRRGAAPRRAVRGALSRHRRLLDRHEAAGQARPGARPRPAPAAPRRADERPRPGRSRRDARADPADRHRVRDRGHPGQPPPRRDRAGLRLPGGDRRRAPPAGRTARHLHRADRRPRGRGRDRRGRRSRPRSSATGWRSSSTAAGSWSPSPANAPTTSSATRAWTWASRSSASSSGGTASRTSSATRCRRHDRVGRRTGHVGSRIERAGARLGTGREHLRPRLPGLRGTAARARGGHPGALLAHDPVVLRDRARRAGQDRAVRARRGWPSLPAVVGVGHRGPREADR